MRQTLPNGFTLIELLITMGIMAILFAITTISLTNLIPRATLAGSLETVIADTKTQQAKAMTGDASGEASPTAQGIHFTQSSYFLFHGSTFNNEAPSNVEVTLSETSQITGNTFPSSNLIFAPGSGEVTNFVDGSNSITLSNTVTGDTTTLTVNRMGVFVEN